MPKMRTPDAPPNAAVPVTVRKGSVSAAKSLQVASAKPAPAFFTTKQLAERWALSERQVQRYIVTGALIATRFGRSVRIGAEEVARFEAALFGVS